VLVRLDLREFVEDRLRQFALLRIENPVIAEKESPPPLLLGLIRAGVGREMLPW